MKINEGIKLATGPAYGECGSLLPLSCPLPRAKAAACRRSPKSPSSCTTRSPKSGSRAPAFSNQGRIKAKTPAIVPHQGKSRHPLKNESSPHRRAIPTRHAPSPPSLDVGRSMLVVGCFGQIPHLRLSAFICGKVPPPSRSPKPEIRARIRPNQGKPPSNQG